MVVMCLLDVVFNAFLIFPSGTLRVLGVTLPGFGLGVLGASMGTALSQVVIAVVLTYILLVAGRRSCTCGGAKRHGLRRHS